MKLRLLSTLNNDRGNTVETIQARLDLVSRHFPELGRLHRVGGHAVAHYGETGEGHAMGFDFRGRREFGLHAGKRGVHILQSLEHINVPGEKQIDFCRAAAGDGADVLQTWHAIHPFLQGAGDGHHHLIDGHDAVIDGDQNAGEIGGGKHRDRNRKGDKGADQREGGNQKNHRPRMTGEPVRRLPAIGGHLLFFLLAGILARRRFTG